MQAFRGLKELLGKLLSLSKPMDGEDLYLYLAVSKHKISLVLVQEEYGVQILSII